MGKKTTSHSKDSKDENRLSESHRDTATTTWVYKRIDLCRRFFLQVCIVGSTVFRTHVFNAPHAIVTKYRGSHPIFLRTYTMTSFDGGIVEESKLEQGEYCELCVCLDESASRVKGIVSSAGSSRDANFVKTSCSLAKENFAHMTDEIKSLCSTKDNFQKNMHQAQDSFDEFTFVKNLASNPEDESSTASSINLMTAFLKLAIRNDESFEGALIKLGNEHKRLSGGIAFIRASSCY